VNIFEAIGVGYTILATTVFTAQLIYCFMKGVSNIRHLIARAQAEKSLDLERAASIKANSLSVRLNERFVISRMAFASIRICRIYCENMRTISA